MYAPGVLISSFREWSGAPVPIDDFDARMQEWKSADGQLADARERLSRALLNGAHSAEAEELHSELLERRATADALLTAVLRDLKMRSGGSGSQ